MPLRYVPLPVNLTIASSSSVPSITSKAVKVPRTPGAKVTLKVQLAPGAIVDPQSLVWAKFEKWAPSNLAETGCVTVPVFVSVTLLGALIERLQQPLGFQTAKVTSVT